VITLRRFYPLVAFLGGFVWDALTIGQQARAIKGVGLALF
jgi:hypothetical protein